jgi:uncharacterized protein (TIRG00374 family)
VLSVALPVLAFQGVNVSEAWRIVTQARPGPVALGGFFFLVALAVRAWRWKHLLAAQQEVRFRSCLSGTCVGFMANNVLPLRLGDLVRAGVLRQLEGANGARVLATVVVEKLLELLTLTFFLGCYLAVAAAGPRQAELLGAGRMALLGAVGVGVFLVAGYWKRTFLQGLLARPVRWLSPRLADRMEHGVGRFLEGLQVFASPGQVLAVVILSAGLWGATVASYYFVGESLGLPLAPGAYVVVVFATAFGVILPAAPGAVGTFHGFARLGLYLVALHSGEQALAFAVLLHAIEWLLMNVTGLYFLARDRVTILGNIKEDPERRPHAAPAFDPEARPREVEYAQPV